MAAHPAFTSVADYLATEPTSPVRREYWNGLVIAMAGASRNHVVVVRNLGRILGRAPLGHGCEEFLSEVKVRIEAANCFLYPDALIACPPNWVDDRLGVIDNPTVVFEILSPSTEREDRGAKFHAYRTLPSLIHYVLISSEEKKIQVYTLENDQWMEQTFTEGEAPLPAVHLALPFATLYEGLAGA